MQLQDSKRKAMCTVTLAPIITQQNINHVLNSVLQLDYTGVAMRSGAESDQDPAAILWAAVVVKPSGQSSRRLGWVLAADLGYCQGSCSLTGEFCGATGSPCCSGTCARIKGNLQRGVPGGTVPFQACVGLQTGWPPCRPRVCPLPALACVPADANTVLLWCTAVLV